MPFYGIASMLGTAFSVDREHALSGQNWFINACAEQPKAVQKYSSGLGIATRVVCALWLQTLFRSLQKLPVDIHKRPLEAFHKSPLEAISHQKSLRLGGVQKFFQHMGPDYE